MLVLCFAGECTVNVVFGVTEHEMWHVARCSQLTSGTWNCRSIMARTIWAEVFMGE